MSLEELFRSAAAVLEQRGIVFAVAGGLAADLYRDEPRLTMDVDLTISSRPSVEKAAASVIEELGLRVTVIRQADLDGGPLFAIRRGDTPSCIVVGRGEGEASTPGIDLLLPEIPWVPDAIERAQLNRVDFGFGAVPALTLEDIIIAKLYALRATPPRAKDLDDLQSVFRAGHDWDRGYVAGQMRRFGITVPRAGAPFLPEEILMISKGIARAKRERS